MPVKKISKMKVKGKRTLKNGAVAGYVYYSKEKKWKWRIIGRDKKQKGGNAQSKMKNPYIENFNNTISEEDIMYQDDDVCILHPDSQKGIIVWTSFNNPNNGQHLCDIGLKTGEKMKENGISFGRSIYHPYIFFRAPYYAPQEDEVNVTTDVHEIVSYYDKINLKNKAFIRVDPERTYVYSSEIRPKIYHLSQSKQEKKMNQSKMLLTKYLRIIRNNELIEQKELVSNKPIKSGFIYNLYTGEIMCHKWTNSYSTNNYTTSPTNRNWEILVRIPHLTSDYFVLCR
tara:strand:- start:759 stop:1613 length:855 start_codon:yes stop_codon:yes gene_type:complete